MHGAPKEAIGAHHIVISILIIIVVIIIHDLLTGVGFLCNLQAPQVACCQLPGLHHKADAAGGECGPDATRNSYIMLYYAIFI